MLTAQQIDNITNNATIILKLREAELDILQDMARRITKMDYATATTRWQMMKLQEMGLQRSYILKKLSAVTGKSEKDLFEAFNDAGTTALATDDSIYAEQGLSPVPLAENQNLQNILRAGLEQSKQTFENLTQQTAINGAQQFGRILDKAYLQITTGAFTYDQAIVSAVKTLARDGLTSIVYPSGRRDNIDVASRRALLTGVNQSALKVSMARAQEMGVTLVEVSAHAGARKDHAEWQGKIYSLK